MQSTAVLAVIKANKPSFSTPSSAVAFASHATISSNGLSLVAVGKLAFSEPYPPISAQEVSIEGWDASSSDGEWSFLYRHNEGSLFLLKCINMDLCLLVTLMALSDKPAAAEGGESSLPPAPSPETLTLEVARFSPSTPPSPSSYTNFQELVDKIQDLLDGQMDLLSSKGSSSMSKAPVSVPNKVGTDKAAKVGTDKAAKVQGQERSALEDPTPSSRSRLRDEDPYWHNPSPLMVGEGDLRPFPGGGGGGLMGPGLGLTDPMYGGLGGAGTGTGGGMHVGPNDPLFAGRHHDPLRMPGGGGRGGLPPGARYDPIAPQGLPGFNPDDFQPQRRGGRGGPRMHPDLMQPGPGRGADWDSMFG